MEIELPQDFKEFLRLLHSHRVNYLLVGGYAVGYHGYPRATNDIDIWIERDPRNAERIVSVLCEFGFDTPELTSGLFIQENSVVQFGAPPMRTYVITTIAGVSFQECYPTGITIGVDDFEIRLIDLANLKINKRASGRHKDLDDLEHLP
jgi:hypothetical protein